MKTILAALVAVGLAASASAASARPIDNFYTKLNETAPRSVFDHIQDSAPRSVFDDLNSSAPRSVFDDIRDSAPRAASGNETVNPNLAGE